MERPVVPPPMIAELRVSCAIVVNETNPPEYDDVPDHREMLKRYIQERDAYRAQAERRAALEKRKSSEPRSHRRPESSGGAHVPSAYRHVPQNAAANFERTTGVRKSTSSYPADIPTMEPLEPTHTKASAKKTEKPQERNEALEQIRATLNVRPKTSAAACVDYAGPSTQSSNSTSRSTTTYNEFGRPSTGETSLAITPSDDKRTSYTTGRVSEQILNDEESADVADAAAKAWMAQELARRRAEYQSTGQAARPGSRATNRPSSRAGSIAESVFEGFRGYIKPRASMDSMRSESGYGLSRSQSRSGSGSMTSNKSNTWSRVKGLRRKNSWSSFRSAKPEPEPTTSSAPDGALNLNRALPALPGLDQYKEKKAKPAHIAQLMGGSRAKSMPNSKHPQQQAPASARPNAGARNMSNPEDQKRQADLKRAVEEKMRMGAIAQSEHLRPHPLVHGNSFYNMQEANMSTVTAPSAPVMNAPQAAPQTRKVGLRKKLSRFWSFSGDKAKSGKMVATT